MQPINTAPEFERATIILQLTEGLGASAYHFIHRGSLSILVYSLSLQAVIRASLQVVKGLRCKLV